MKFLKDYLAIKLFLLACLGLTGTVCATETAEMHYAESENPGYTDEPENNKSRSGALLIGLYEINPDFGMNLGGTVFFNLNQPATQDLNHGVALTTNTLLFFTTEDVAIDAARFSTVSFDAGLGYGISTSNLMSAITINIPLVQVDAFLFSDSDKSTSWDFFKSDDIYLRIQGSWFPFTSTRSFLSGLGLGGAFDAGLVNGDSRVILGLSFQRRG